jgi:hypothetical protein
LPELEAMAMDELSFWQRAGALRSNEIMRTARDFWKKNLSLIRSGANFAAQHELLLAAASTDLPLNPIKDPKGLIERARAAAGADKWPGLLPPTDELVFQYFPVYRPAMDLLLRPDKAATSRSISHEPEP